MFRSKNPAATDAPRGVAKNHRIGESKAGIRGSTHAGLPKRRNKRLNKSIPIKKPIIPETGNKIARRPIIPTKGPK